jgi:glycosyltransferase involved in cell wall biosynthesis
VTIPLPGIVGQAQPFREKKRTMTSDAPRVSVVIPTCNRSNLLSGAISSVLSQTWYDFELLVVDDASEDQTSEVVASFSDPRIVYLRQEQRLGGGATRNTGINNSRGEIIAFLDDDDEWLPEKLARQMRIFLSNPSAVGVVYTGYWIIDWPSSKVVGQKTPVKRGDLSREILLGNCVGGTSSVAVRKSCFAEVGLFDQRLTSYQDYDLWIRMAKSFHFDFIQEPLVKYHLHQKKIWTNLAALKSGMDLMMEKYGDSPGFRKYQADKYLSLGVRFCRQGDVRSGRETLIKAIHLDPFQVRNYFYLFMSLLGAKGFTRAELGKDLLFKTRAATEISRLH